MHLKTKLSSLFFFMLFNVFIHLKQKSRSMKERLFFDCWKYYFESASFLRSNADFSAFGH